MALAPPPWLYLTGSGVAARCIRVPSRHTDLADPSGRRTRLASSARRSMTFEPTLDEGKKSTHSLPLLTYSAPGALRQDPCRAAESSAEARTDGNGIHEVRVLLLTYDSRGGVEPLLPPMPA